MHEFVTTLLPLLLFMLTPVLIPVVAVLCGALLDRIAPQPVPVRVRSDQRS